jgi:uncharacterized protein with ATP-grasp and redox domains
MEITKEEFESYLDVQESGVTNMFAVNIVSNLTGLSREKIFYIMDNYGELKKKFA